MIFFFKFSSYSRFSVNGLLSTPRDTINDPQPGTSGQQALGRLDSWTNLRDPDTAPAISRQDTLDLNPVCVDPRTMIFKIENDNGMLKWPSQGEWCIHKLIY